MDKRDTRMVELLSNQINFYTDTLQFADKLHDFARNVGKHKLAICTFKVIESLNDLVGHFTTQQNAIMTRNGAVKVPVKDCGKPELTLVVNNGPIEINFKGARTKSSNPLW